MSISQTDLAWTSLAANVLAAADLLVTAARLCWSWAAANPRSLTRSLMLLLAASALAAAHCNADAGRRAAQVWRRRGREARLRLQLDRR